MKANPLRLCPLLLLLLVGGCLTEGYGPGSPDYYPVNNPPFLQMSNPRPTPSAPPEYRADHSSRQEWRA